MGNILRMNSLRRIANKSSRDSLIRLFSDRLEGRVSEAEFVDQAREILASGPHFGGKSDAMTDLIRQTQSSYQGGQPKNPVQSEALAETVYQKAINRLHLADYQARGTRLVQVRAIMDSKTTEHCKGMHGRIFRVGDLVKEDHNQSELVRSKGFWESAEYFQGTPTYEVIPGIPPYHFGCRTRLVPYTDAEAYESFDTMAADHPLYATILKDKLQNYEIGPDNLPAVRDYAGGCEWKEGSLEYHFGKHNPEFRYRFTDENAYSEAAYGLLEAQDTTLMLYISEYGENLKLYAFAADPHSRSGNWQFVVFDLDSLRIQSYYKKDFRDVDQFIKRSDYRKQVFGKLKKARGEKTMDILDDYPLEHALLVHEELRPTDMYEYVYEAVRDKDTDDMYAYQDSCVFFRQYTLRVLMDAGKLSAEELERIRKVDEFILAAEWLPRVLVPLKEWLKAR